MANDDFISGFMNDYFEESDEHLATLRGLLLSLDSLDGVQQIAPSTLDEMFRVFHSIKGISGMVELREAERLARELESYLRALRQREAILTPAGVDALVAGVDALERVIVARRLRSAARSLRSRRSCLAGRRPLCPPMSSCLLRGSSLRRSGS